MAATQVARNNSLNGFDEFVNLPASPSLTPRLQPARAIHTATASSFNMRTVGLDENQPPPPPGSSPEALFRYYLAAELRKAGTRPDEALLDRYVKNHFDSLFKNKPQQQQQQPVASTSRPVLGPSMPTNTNAMAKSAAPVQIAEPISIQRLPVPRTSPSSSAAVTAACNVAGPSSQPIAKASADACSPPELQESGTPSLSVKSFSPLPTPPALEAVAEDEELDFSKAFKQGASSFGDTGLDTFDFVGSSNVGGGAFRTSPFRLSPDETVSIDPHMVEMGSASSFNHNLLDGMAVGQSSKPCAAHAQNDVAPMSEDGLSDDDEEDSKERLAKQLQMQQVQPRSDEAASQFAPFQSPGADESGARDGIGAGLVGSEAPTGDAATKRAGAAHNLKPDPEEYKKLSSKEKRQLRNKISARNFRTRRKEYIGHLEEQVADRDSIIEGLRQQLSQITMEKVSLQEEVRILKSKTISSNDVEKILEALQKNLPPINTTLTVPATNSTAATGSTADFAASMAPSTPSAFINFLDSSRPSTPIMAASSGAMAPGSPRSSSPRPSLLRRSSPSLIPQPNTKKDVGPQSSFWGGIGNSNGQSFTSVC